MGPIGFFLHAQPDQDVRYSALAQYAQKTLTASLLLTPFLVLAVLPGFRLHRLMSQALFTSVADAFPAVAGLKLLRDAALAT